MAVPRPLPPWAAVTNARSDRQCCRAR